MLYPNKIHAPPITSVVPSFWLWCLRCRKFIYFSNCLSGTILSKFYLYCWFCNFYPRITHLSLCQSLCLTICLPLCLPLSLSLYLSLSLSLSLSFSLSLSLSCLSLFYLCLSIAVCISHVCLFCDLSLSLPPLTLIITLCSSLKLLRLICGFFYLARLTFLS